MSAESLTGLPRQTLEVIAKGKTVHFRDWVKNARAEEFAMNQLAMDESKDPELRIKASAQATKLRAQLFEAVGVPTRPTGQTKATPVGPMLDADPVG